MNSSLQTGNIDSVELASGLTRHTLDHGSIVVYTFRNNRRATIDAWANRVINTSETWPDDRPYLILYDLSRTFLSPYFRKRANDVNTIPRPEIFGAYAVVLPDSVVGQLIRLFVKRDLPPPTYYAESEVFTAFDEAVVWLRKVREEFTQRIQAND